MTKRIRVVGRTCPEVRVTSRGMARVEPDELAAALGAEPASSPPQLRGSPASLLALRQRLARSLVPTGGRPALPDASRRQKIPFTPSDWELLRELAERLVSAGVHPSAGQVASFLLREALREWAAVLEAEPADKTREVVAPRRSVGPRGLRDYASSTWELPRKLAAA